jgi:hypothetical protein
MASLGSLSGIQILIVEVATVPVINGVDFLSKVDAAKQRYAAGAALSKRVFAFSTRLTLSTSSAQRKGFATQSKPR